MDEKVTIKSIAKASGFSIGTIDRALNDRGRIKLETKEKILSIADQLGYKPNKLASALSKNQTIRLVAVFPFEPDYYYQKIKDGMLDAQNELNEYSIQLDFFHPESLEPKTQIEMLANINKLDLNGLILSPGDDSLDKLINSFVDHGIPTVTIANDTPTSKRLFYIGQNMYRAGMLGGELIGKLLSGRGNVLTLIAFSTVYSLEKRYLGFEDMIKKEYPNIQIIGPYEFHDWDNVAHNIVANAIANEEIDGIFVASAAGTVGAARALEESTLLKKPVLVGYDDVAYIKEMIKAGIIHATITQDPYSQGFYSVKLLAKNIVEGWLPKEDELFTSLQVLMKSNIDDLDFVKNLDNF